MKAKVIGVGACGNKAAISLLTNGVIEDNQIMLLNTTLKDIPDDYRSLAIKFSDNLGGCGKEPEIAKELAMQALKDEKISLDTFFDPDDEMVIIVCSSEGGTGCGASSIIARYCKEVLDMNVHMFVFTGFEEDGRGLLNTVNYFKNLSEDYTVEAISNKKFLDAYTNKIQAEKNANTEFAQRVRILLGQILIDSEQNIDETDLYKLTTTPGFMTIENASLDKCKSLESYNNIIRDMIDNTKSLDYVPSCKRLGVIINASDKVFVDYTHTLLKTKIGVPFETYLHVQDEKDLPEMIAIIVSGIDMPIDEVQGIYNKYKEESDKVNKSRDSFFSSISNMEVNDEDEIFNLKKRDNNEIKSKKASFFSDKKEDTESKNDAQAIEKY